MTEGPTPEDLCKKRVEQSFEALTATRTSTAAQGQMDANSLATSRSSILSTQQSLRVSLYTRLKRKIPITNKAISTDFTTADGTALRHHRASTRGRKPARMSGAPKDILYPQRYRQIGIHEVFCQGRDIRFLPPPQRNDLTQSSSAEHWPSLYQPRLDLSSDNAHPVKIKVIQCCLLHEK
jgi:hypothetical protein